MKGKKRKAFAHEKTIDLGKGYRRTHKEERMFSPQEIAMLDQITCEIERAFADEIRFISQLHRRTEKHVNQQDQAIRTLVRIEDFLGRDFLALVTAALTPWYVRPYRYIKRKWRKNNDGK